MSEVITLFAERARVDVSGCASGSRVWLFGRPFHDFSTLSNADRCASALMTLDALGLLSDPKGEVRRMLVASVERIGESSNSARNTSNTCRGDGHMAATASLMTSDS